MYHDCLSLNVFPFVGYTPGSDGFEPHLSHRDQKANALQTLLAPSRIWRRFGCGNEQVHVGMISRTHVC